MIVYADVIFLENLIINFIILYVTSLIKKIKKSYARIFLSSTLGSIYSVIYIVINKENIFLKLLLSIVMVIIINPTKKIKKIIETLFLFYLISVTAGGAALAISYIINENKVILFNKMTVISFPILSSVMGVIVGILLIVSTINNLKNKISRKDIFYSINIFIGEKNKKITALLDTGNMLKDPFTNKPVIIATKRSLKGIISEEIINNIELIIGGDRIGKLISTEDCKRIKVIPFNSLGNEHGILVGIKSDKIIVDDCEIKDVIIGLYEKEFSKTKRYDALIGIDLLYEEECNYETYRKVKK